jgi:hypothetical protein
MLSVAYMCVAYAAHLLCLSITNRIIMLSLLIPSAAYAECCLCLVLLILSVEIKAIKAIILNVEKLGVVMLSLAHAECC